MTSEGLGEMFEGDSQTREPENFRSRRWGAKRRVSRAQSRKRGPPSARAEILSSLSKLISSSVLISSMVSVFSSTSDNVSVLIIIHRQ